MSDLKSRTKAPKVSEELRVLKQARAFLSKKHNWCQQAAKGKARCAAMALADIACNDRLLNSAMTMLAYGLPYERQRGLSIVYFNDNPTTTHADILALFDRAIERASR